MEGPHQRQVERQLFRLSVLSAPTGQPLDLDCKGRRAHHSPWPSPEAGLAPCAEPWKALLFCGDGVAGTRGKGIGHPDRGRRSIGKFALSSSILCGRMT